MFCFTCTGKLWSTMVATVSKRYPVSLHCQKPVRIQGLTTRSSLASAAAQAQNIKKRVQRRKPITVEDTGQEKSVSI